MPKYNLMQNQKPASVDRYIDEKEQKPGEKQEEKTDNFGQDSEPDVNLYTPPDLEDLTGDSFFPQDIDETVKEEDLQSTSEESSIKEEVSIEGTGDAYENQLQSEEVITHDPVSFKQKNTFQAYEDEKQEGMNFKPFIISFVIIVVLAAAYYGITKYVLVDKTNVPTPVQPVKSALDIKKENVLNIINISNRQRVGYLNSLIDISSKNVKYSSILLYDKNLSLEVFGSNRDDVAKFNILMKNNNQIREYRITSTDIRPGSKGGVFALFDIKLDANTNASNKEKTQVDSQSSTVWMNNVRQTYKLSMNSSRQISSKQEDPFKVSRNEFIFQGAESNCHRLIKQIASGNSNFKVHKLSLIPMDQRDMKNSSYQLKLIMDFYN